MTSRYECECTGVFDGRRLDYLFSMDLYPVSDAAGSEELGTASVFSYVADVPADERARRPVMFVFNGGPGGSSSFLHLSGIGPKRVAIPADLTMGILPPYVLEDSAHSLLDTADLVFLDPVDTGYGRSNADADCDELYSTQGDARYFADTVRTWVARHDRWDSPKYIVGESYGTHRAPFMATALMGLDAVPVDGLVLLGQALNVQETLDRPGNIAGAIASLPFTAATAWYHGKALSEHTSVEEVVEAALEFAHGELAMALVKGNLLTGAERKQIAAALERFTGISADKHLRRRLYFGKTRFCKELFEESGKVLGRNDARYVSLAADPATGEAEIEPSTTYLGPAFTAGAIRYFHGTLGIPFDTEYKLFDASAAKRWDWSDSGSSNFMQMGKPSPFHTYPYPARLTQYLKQVPEARLFIATGYYDSLTTVGAVQHLLRQYDIPLDRVTERRYPAGHMMYSDPDVSRQLNADLRAFVTPAPRPDASS